VRRERRCLSGLECPAESGLGNRLQKPTQIESPAAKMRLSSWDAAGGVTGRENDRIA
jgi:hypothetical protein